MSKIHTKIYLALKTIENIGYFIIDYAGLLRRDIVYRIRNKNIKIISRGGTPDCKEVVVVLSGYEYKLNVLPIIKNPVIFDIGAHIGTFSLYALDFYASSHPNVFIFEPERENYEYLCRNIALNNVNPDNYVVYKCAIGDYNGVGYIDKTKQNDSYTLSSSPQGFSEENTIVKTITNISNHEGIRNIDVLKLDIEGYEYNIFSHEESLEFINNRVFYILMEYHYVNSAKNEKWLKAKLKNNFDIIYEKNNTIYLKNKILT
jgi:FkbM family methyltransferase